MKGTMKRMRIRAVVFFVTFLFLVPSALSSLEKFDPKAVMGSSDKCLDERVVIFNGKVITQPGRTDGVRYQTCKNISGGCTFAKEKAEPAECTCGRLVFTPVGKKPIPLDKCDPNFKKNFEKAMAGGIEGMTDFAAQALISQRLQEVKVDTQDGRDQLSKVLQNYGLSEGEADAKVSDEDKAATVQAQLKKFVSTSDTDEANTIARQLGFRLNKDLTDEVRLDPKKFAGVLKEDDFERLETAVPFTFQEVVRGVVADTLAPLCGRLGGCSDSACFSNPGTLTCRTNNPGALTWALWESKYGGQPCGQNNNTTCFPSLEHGLAAKIDLLTSSRYLGGDNNTILKLLCNGYSPDRAGNNCNAYAVFVQNQTGISMNQTIDSKDPEQVGKIAMAMARMENGRFVPFTPQQLENAMTLVYGGKLPNGTPGFVSQMAYGTNGGTPFGSPLGFNRSASPATVGYGSAFGYATPAPAMPASYSQPQQTPPTPQRTVPPAVTSRPQTTSSSSTVAQELERALQNPSDAQAGRLMANIVVQESEVTRGNPVQVSWTSIGTSAATPCVLRANSTVIAEGNQGSKVVPTTQATRVGSLVFTLSCTTASGVTFQRTAAVMVR